MHGKYCDSIRDRMCYAGRHAEQEEWGGVTYDVDGGETEGGWGGGGAESGGLVGEEDLLSLHPQLPAQLTTQQHQRVILRAWG